MNAIKKIAGSALQHCAKGGFALVCAMGMVACSSLPQPPVRSDVYDFGPGQVGAAAAPRARAALVLPPVAMDNQSASDTALYYRLAYANAQLLRPYSLARWSQSPALLLTQALRARLGQDGAVLSVGTVALAPSGGRLPGVLRVELEEFSQVFDSPQASHALLRARASLLANAEAGEQLQAQKLFVVQRSAATPDAAGGARALADAAAQLADELAQWLDGQP